MQFELETLCKKARAEIQVPPLPIESIRSARLRRIDPKPKRRLFLAVMILAFSTAAVAAATIADRVTITMSSSGIVLNSHDARIFAPANVEAAAKAADFPVTMPSALPFGWNLEKISAGKNLIALQYGFPGKWRLEDHMLTFFLMNAVEVKRSSPDASARRYHVGIGYSHKYRVVFWHVGAEVALVVADERAIGARQLAAIRASMVENSRR